MPKQLSTANKTTAVGAGVGVVTSYAAALAAQKWSVPIEVAAVAVGGMFGWVARWAGKLVP